MVAHTPLTVAPPPAARCGKWPGAGRAFRPIRWLILGHAGDVTSRSASALADLARKVAVSGDPGLDRLRLVPVPSVPEVRLYLAEDPIVWWARMEAEAGEGRQAAPFWASAWPGGQALARHVLDHPDLVAGRRVLDLAAGSGLVAIAVALAGAATVTANDIDPYACAATTLNARANGVTVTTSLGDLLDADAGGADVVLAGDVFYSESMADRVLAFLQRATATGAAVLVGDPGRRALPRNQLQVVARYEVSTAEVFADAEIQHTEVLRPVG